EDPEEGVHVLVDADYLNAVNLAINTVENTLPGKVDAAALATVATSGAYDDLIGAPFIPTEPDDIGAQPAGSYATTSQLAGKADAEHTHGVEDIDATGTPSSSTFLRGDGAWATPAGGVDEEAVRDIIADALVAGSNVTIDVDDTEDTITISASGGGSGGGAVDSVNGQTGEVVLEATDVGAAEAEHTHEITDIDGLQTALNGKAAATVTANTQTGSSYTLVLSDAAKVVEMNNVSSNTLTVPPNSSVAFPTGTIIEVYQAGSGQTTIAAGAGVTLRAPNGLKLANQYSTATLRKRGSDEWVVTGDVTS